MFCHKKHKPSSSAVCPTAGKERIWFPSTCRVCLAAPGSRGHPGGSNFPQNHKAAFTQRLPGVASGFTATLPENTNISAAATGKGEEKPLHLPASPGVSQAESKTSLGSASCHAEHQVQRGGEKRAPEGHQTQPHSNPHDQGSSSARLAEAAVPAGGSPLCCEVHKVLGEAFRGQLGRRLLHHLLELLEGRPPGLVGEAENGQFNLGMEAGQRETHARHNPTVLSQPRVKGKPSFP